jgi:hypothetical protein
LELRQEAAFDAWDESAGRLSIGLERVAVARNEGVDVITQVARGFQQESSKSFVAGKLSGDFEDCSGTAEYSFRREEKDC